MKEEQWKELENFLDTHCVKVGGVEEDEMLAKIYPGHEGTYQIHVDQLKKFIDSIMESKIGEVEKMEIIELEVEKGLYHQTVDRDKVLSRLRGQDKE